ncbi:MAG: polysaccharide biosynthesis protein [Oscillospiraceae bacterium]|jgi:FlaA1/EpsC-like NDP-sugar epimerase|nr:polysaccharide biosynthesis protein [Oscillospiraceae bacterium]
MFDMYEQIKKYKKYMLFLLDLIIWNISFYLSFAINKSSFSLIGFEDLFIKYLLLVNFCFSFVSIVFKIYDKIWRYADIEDFFYSGLSTFCANFLFFIITFMWNMNIGIRTYVLFLLVSEFLNLIIRLIYRVNIILDCYTSRSQKHRRRLLVVGAGEASAMVLRELSKHSDSEYLPICIVDDDRSKIRRSIAGVRVRGSTYEITQICKDENIEIILFAILNIENTEKRRILDTCARTGLETRMIPSIYETVSSQTNIVPAIRHVEIEDLLGREPVTFEKHYGNYVIGKNILITGGGGSIGSELCRQIAEIKPKNLIILDICENGAYQIQQELCRIYRKNKEFNFEIQIASVRDKAKIEKIFSKKNIDVVFHAAAHKHVPLMENNPEEAVKNNVFGTLILANAAKKYKIKKFVLISTDKAVNPTSVMGATKRICEMIIQFMSEESKSTEFVAVRFGNVLGSSGSVIPLFEEQIKHKGPVTVTHPEIIRYFMTITEAVSLVLTAGAIAKGGEIFILDMGAPVKIKDLAENLIRLSGFVPNENIKIEYTGLRPGEKLYEELLMEEEGITKTENEKIYIGNPIKFNTKKFQSDLDRLKEACDINETDLVRKIVAQIVPFGVCSNEN